MHRPSASRGFTLIELVMVMVMVGALAVFAMPRLIDTTMWRLRAYGDELQSRMQAALRMSLAQRRPIVASINPTGVVIAYAAGGTIASLPCPAAVPNCITESGTRTASFNAGNLGRVTTSTGSALSVTVSGGGYSQAFRLEAETGLFHMLP